MRRGLVVAVCVVLAMAVVSVGFARPPKVERVRVMVTDYDLTLKKVTGVEDPDLATLEDQAWDAYPDAKSVDAIHRVEVLHPNGPRGERVIVTETLIRVTITKLFDQSVTADTAASILDTAEDRFPSYDAKLRIQSHK